MKKSGDGNRHRRPVVVVLVDAHHSLGRPLCSDAALCEAISAEVCDDFARGDARAPWRLLGGAASSAKRKEELRNRIAATTRAVLSGEQLPPRGLARAVDAVAQELDALLAAHCVANVVCQVFCADEAAGVGAAGVASAMVPALFGGVPPARLVEVWDAALVADSTPPPTFEQVCAAGFRGATLVLVISSRGLPPLQQWAFQVAEGADAMPTFSWVCCSAGVACLPEDASGSSGISTAPGDGHVSVAGTQVVLRNVLREILGLEDEPEQPVPAPQMQPSSDGNGANERSSGAEKIPAQNDGVQPPQDFPAFDVSWTLPGPLGLDFQGGSWIVSYSSPTPPSSEVQVGDLLVRVNTGSDVVVASGHDAAPPVAVVAALRSECRPLTLTFARFGGGDQEEKSKGMAALASVAAGRGAAVAAAAVGLKKFAGGLFAPPTRETSGSCGATDTADGSLRAACSEEGNSDIAALVLKKHASELQKLSADGRRARIRELVAEELSRRSADANDPIAVERRCEFFVRQAIGKALDAEREPNQRILLEWLLILCRSLSFCGDATTLARASMCNRRWRSSLHPGGSDLASRLWKWTVRFGTPVADQHRWQYWHWLMGAGGQALRRSKNVSRPCPRAAGSNTGDTLQTRRGVGYFEQRLEQCRSDESLADARSVIAADLPRTFAPGRENSECGHRRLFPTAPSRLELEERRAALDRILFALAAEHPTVGYCQGLDVVAAFALSVAEEAGVAREDLEAQTFAFLASALELEYISSWLEPPLDGLRAASAVLRDLLATRQPRLVAHLNSEGACVELLGLPWLQTLLVGLVPLSRESLCRVWECWLLDGTPKVFLRLILRLLGQAEREILGEPLERICELLRSFPPPMDVGLERRHLLAGAWAVKVTNSSLRRALATAQARVVEERKAAEADEARNKEHPAKARQGRGLEMDDDEAELEEAAPDIEPSARIWGEIPDEEEELAFSCSSQLQRKQHVDARRPRQARPGEGNFGRTHVQGEVRDRFLHHTSFPSVCISYDGNLRQAAGPITVVRSVCVRCSCRQWWRRPQGATTYVKTCE